MGLKMVVFFESLGGAVAVQRGHTGEGQRAQNDQTTNENNILMRSTIVILPNPDVGIYVLQTWLVCRKKKKILRLL